MADTVNYFYKEKEYRHVSEPFAASSEVIGLPEHYRPRQFAFLWETALDNWKERLTQAIEQWAGNNTPNIFFRADDIGVGSCAFDALCRLFRTHEIPLALAVVPAWLSGTRCEWLFRCAPLEERLWGWHQHGWRHVNWQRTGKKSEFGDHRALEKQIRDITQGQQKMLDTFGEHALPVFTPPWNRISSPTIKVLQQLGFKGISMEMAIPRSLKPAVTMKSFRVQLDLHTRKAVNGEEDYNKLVEELVALLSKREPIGIMIHHQRMTIFAFEFLNELIRQLKDKLHARFLSFRELLEK